MLAFFARQAHSLIFELPSDFSPSKARSLKMISTYGWVNTRLGWAKIGLASGRITSLEFSHPKQPLGPAQALPDAVMAATECFLSGLEYWTRLGPKGTDFQISVWRALTEIPLGKTSTYGAIARKVASASHARSIGQACASNAIAVFIPCHRVLGKEGFGGYKWGQDRKVGLLKWEKRGGDPRDLFLSYFKCCNCVDD